jgi:membrane protease YdiL (CAAX protease family)
MGANIALLLTLSFALDKAYLSFLVADLRSRPLQKILAGIFSAVLLYLIFYAGNYLSRAIFPFAAGGIARVYSFRQNASTLRIILLMFFLIGPGEELFWRGFIQRHWQNRFGPMAGWLGATALYSLVHWGSGNVMLVLAALICGLFWGALFLRYRSPFLVAVSHTVWDVLIFVALPLESGPR